jgi:branched-chain amino acid transport system permease protein
MLFGWVSTRRSGTVFAMISLGLAELVGSSSLILRSFFGGEEGVTTNRTKLFRVLDLSFGPQIQVYYLIAAWCLLCAALIYAITHTPLGRMCNAVRDNPERVSFVGYNPHLVRYIVFCLAGLFAGVAGGLAAINFELANAALFGAAQSGNVLLATFVGGSGQFIGPILGAVLVTFLQTMLSDVTEVWQLYFGLMFIAVVMYAPGGLAGLIMMHEPSWRAGTLSRLLPAYALLLLPVALLAAGGVLLLESLARLSASSTGQSSMSWGGWTLDAKSWQPWALSFAMLAGGRALFRLARARAAFVWDEVHSISRDKGPAK